MTTGKNLIFTNEKCVGCNRCIPVSINYSINQFSDDGYVDYLETLLQQYNIDPKYVEIEITESVILEKTSQTNTLFQRLKEHGDDVIRLVHDLNKEMTIEGVEEKWQYLRLKEFGADTIQGYYFSKPLMQEDAIRFTPSAEKPQ